MVRGATGVGFAGWLSLLCLAAPARAGKPGQAFRLEYWADGACPDAAEFARQIQTRAPRLRLAEGDEPALGFYAELGDHGHGASGRLTARSADGREVVREVRGPTCEDVAIALALIAALATIPTRQSRIRRPKPRQRRRKRREHAQRTSARPSSTSRPRSSGRGPSVSAPASASKAASRRTRATAWVSSSRLKASEVCARCFLWLRNAQSRRTPKHKEAVSVSIG